MTQIENLQTQEDAAAEPNLPAIIEGTNQAYAGDVTPKETWQALTQSDNAILVDVRTQAEWVFVGVPNLHDAGCHLLTIEWQEFPAMSFNEGFLAQLEAAAPDKQAAIFFLCRSGARSQSAAILATKSGYAHAYNVAGGFEGDANQDRQRGCVNGWKAEGLPWQQG
ncbi:MAG: rhodanese-like domain-containing protein [Parvibaculales bacterium]